MLHCNIKRRRRIFLWKKCLPRLRGHRLQAQASGEVGDEAAAEDHAEPEHARQGGGRLQARPGLGGEAGHTRQHPVGMARSEEHTSELQSLMRISYAVFCLTKKHQMTSLTY